MTEGYEVVFAKKKAIIIHCSQPDIQEPFNNFIAEKLGFKSGEFVPIIVAGGPAALAHPRKRHDDFWFLVNQISFFLDKYKTIKILIIIGHEKCGYYDFIENHPDQEDKERKDLPRAVDGIKRTTSVKARSVRVEAYYGSYTSQTPLRMSFSKIQ